MIFLDKIEEKGGTLCVSDHQILLQDRLCARLAERKLCRLTFDPLRVRFVKSHCLLLMSRRLHACQENSLRLVLLQHQLHPRGSEAIAQRKDLTTFDSYDNDDCQEIADAMTVR